MSYHSAHSRTLIAITFLFILGLYSHANATIWFVDHNEANNPDFSSLQTAHDGAADGDTIYVAGSGQNYGHLTSTKSLHWYGPGYFLHENAGQQALPFGAVTSWITFNEGSSGSTFTGFTVNQAIVINANSIIINRNHISYGGQYSIDCSGLSNIIICQNYINNSYPNQDGRAVDIVNSNFILILNNYIVQLNSRFTVDDGYSSSGVRIWNNVLHGHLRVNSASIANNILSNGNYYNGDNLVLHNLSDANQFGNLNGNQPHIDMNSIFVGGDSPDGQWMLSEDSPARGAGLNGVDCGMYGGDSPYVLSGLPPIPVISEFTAPVQANGEDGLPVFLRVRSVR